MSRVRFGSSRLPETTIASPTSRVRAGSGLKIVTSSGLSIAATMTPYSFPSPLSIGFFPVGSDFRPAGAPGEKANGYRVSPGGKPGRRPRLAKEMPGVFDGQGVVRIVEACLALYKKKSRRGGRFAEVPTDADFEGLVDLFPDRSTRDTG